MLVPRALKQKSQQTESKTASTSVTQASGGESTSETQIKDTEKKSGGMSNSDFRNLLLKK